MIPGATVMCSQGAYELPQFAGLPVSARDLLRISTRLTVVRCVAYLLLAIPTLTAWAFIAQVPEDKGYAFHLLPLLMLLWIVSRPIFIAYRLVAKYTPRSGTLFGECATFLVIAFLEVGWLFSAFGIGVELIAFTVAPEIGYPWMKLAAWLCGCALCARAAFEVLHWRIRSGKVDLIRRI